MSNPSPENFNLNLLNSSADGASMGPAGHDAPAEDGSSFAAQLAGGGNGDFIIPTPKKKVSGVLIAFVGIAVVAGGGLWWMNQRTGGPTPAEAADPNVSAARESIQQFLAGGTGSVAEMKSLLADSRQITDKFETYSENRQVPLQDLKTNPFFTETDEDDVVVDDAPAVDLSRQQLEERARREAERVRLEQERLALVASKLQVQTIFYGKSPTALVDGKICQVGQQLGEFTVSAIRPDAVEVKSGKYTFEVKLKQ